ncbi:NrfD/PsrC family molybdoenzyme membrane anchor subunit [Salisediminibacterium halotolerans]|uniref:NrfD/PsrC family molybdoenzyme membrane anchor subunit n=1 Tax=Salisediminibacterium halotolerans TaxID=517425 RepID=UPI000EB2257C|nr:NrfD/PsrC family molybdoenzyme membrane anchor subunit [Salisediminibacterium halotolerans]RLJ69254.1 molybdopterin-containing oxidoreductase family membrane subunit [Actinophytocola xinjiangensis]RPE87011.1 molybdopterin-containing oxidoreductase family membrane subunit [Salisediminibacterium halotolerans]TWG32256.1 molybdopterin-containing oxidoreductase family membrane subunit [Salisediminibacterium halotolerans]GEL08005.1 oxidoreductase [Salisediminibacterium halotolerans]
MTEKLSFNKTTIAVIAVLLVVVAAGVFAMVNTLIQGQVLFGSSDQVPWNLLIVAYVFLALMASGMCMFASGAHLFGFEKYQFLGKRSIFLALAVLIPGLVVLAMDLGRLDRVYYFITSPNLQAPMWWMGATYGIYVVLLLAEFIAMHVKNEKVMHYLSYFTLVGAVAATSILGGIFATAVQRPLWYGGSTSVFFVLSALLTGVAALSIFVYFTQKSLFKQASENVSYALSGLSKLLGVLLAVALGFNAWKLITMFYTGTPDFAMIFNGEYALLYWGGVITIGLVIPLIALIVSRSPVTMVVASSFALIGMFIDKYVTVIGGQLVQPFGQEMAVYSTTVTEWLIFIGAMAATVVIYMLGIKYLSLDDHDPHQLKDEKEDRTAAEAL